MPWYNDLRPTSDDGKIDYSQLFPELKNTDRKRIIRNLLALRNGLKQEIPAKESEKNLLLCSWNIKEFGHLSERLPEAYFYIAEILNRFDLVAIQEIKSSLYGLEIIMKLLGENWAYFITDITEGTAGNKERFAYLYDKRKVKPSGLSGEIVLWDELTTASEIKQLKRTPAITGFIAGWKKFSLINIHLQPGNSAKDKKYRKLEIELLLKVIRHKLDKKHFWNENLFLVGDFNIYQNNQDMIQMLTESGFRECEGLQNKFTNVSNSETYTRMFMNINEYFKLVKDESRREKGSVFSIFDYVFTEENWQEYQTEMLLHKDNPETLTTENDFMDYFHRYWKRNQMSDHNPIWLEIEIDSSDDFLQNKLEEMS